MLFAFTFAHASCRKPTQFDDCRRPMRLTALNQAAHAETRAELEKIEAWRRWFAIWRIPVPQSVEIVSNLKHRTIPGHCRSLFFIARFVAWIFQAELYELRLNASQGSARQKDEGEARATSGFAMMWQPVFAVGNLWRC